MALFECTHEMMRGEHDFFSPMKMNAIERNHHITLRIGRLDSRISARRCACACRQRRGKPWRPVYMPGLTIFSESGVMLSLALGCLLVAE